MTISCTNIVASSPALPSVVFTEDVKPSGEPANDVVSVELQIAGSTLVLNPYKLRELKAMLASAERALERQSERQFLARNLTLDL